MLSAKKTDDGGFAIDPSDLFAVFETKQVDQCSMAEDAGPSVEGSESPGTNPMPETAATTDAIVAFAALGTQKCLFELPPRRQRVTNCVRIGMRGLRSS